ncbi:hypothetical protein [Candidatus Berkiella aquae]|uniref:Uncharacterized protein n=1 Tax=Candidatus Berkiella aquae TaxID=295108 RepID=A0A0Q9YMI4_9GAMM|nr:hypothetical protein [Candidatus Berkiella aquae]MCS5709981.1 hypothetical protein [Candidatus Berkiella aquae]
MRTLNQQDCLAVNGAASDGYRLTFVAVDIMDPGMAPQVAVLVGRLLSGQSDPSTIADAVSQAGGSLVEYLLIAPH